MKEIVITSGIRKSLIDKFGVSRKTVYESLTYKLNSEKAKEIRKEAQELGGTLIGDDSVITYHDSDDTMVQKFGNRIELVLWKQDDKVQIYIDGIWKEEYIGMSIDEFMKLQDRLTEKAKTL